MGHIDNRIYLASQSPRRRELLKQLGVHFEVLVMRTSPGREDVMETPRGEEMPAQFAVRMAREKSQSGARIVRMRRLVLMPVLGADTVLDVDGEMIGKPRGMDHAKEILTRLSGRTHWVHTGVAMTWTHGTESRLSSSKVEFAPISGETITRYLESGEALDKAGAYGIQGRAGAFAKRIEGSYTGIMGLPLYETSALLTWAEIRI
jgi:septum formation protein